MRKNLPVTKNEIDYSADQVFITKTNTKGIITYANDSFVEISGFTREELIGQPHNLVRHPDMPEWAFADLWATGKSGYPWCGLVKNRAKNGDYYWVKASVSPIKDGKDIIGYISVRKKPTREEVARTEALYATKPTLRQTLLCRFRRMPVQTKVQLLIQPILFLLLSAANLAISIYESRHLSSSYLAEMIAVQIGLQVAIYFLLAWVIGRFVCQPVGHVTYHLDKLVGGNSNMEQQADITGRDEMGEILCAVQSTKVMTASVIDQMKAASGYINRFAGRLSSSAQDVTSNAMRQSDSVSSVAAAVQQMSVTIEQISGNADAVKNISSNSKAVADEGEHVVNEAIGGMEQVHDSIMHIAGTVEMLGERSREIQQVVNIIKEIAGRTNLLALNAAIEAARAGDHGRGFAVVADEVRLLAEKTATATGEIQNMVERINDATNQTVQEMSDVVQRIDVGKMQTENTSRAIREINDSVGKVLNGVEDILSSLQEQTRSSHDIAMNIETIAAMTEKNGEIVAGVDVAAKELVVYAAELNSSVSHYRI